MKTHFFSSSSLDPASISLLSTSHCWSPAPLSSAFSVMISTERNLIHTQLALKQWNSFVSLINLLAGITTIRLPSSWSLYVRWCVAAVQILCCLRYLKQFRKEQIVQQHTAKRFVCLFCFFFASRMNARIVKFSHRTDKWLHQSRRRPFCRFIQYSLETSAQTSELTRWSERQQH